MLKLRNYPIENPALRGKLWCIFIALVFLASFQVKADTIALNPTSPSSATPTTLQIDGVSPVSTAVFFRTMTIQGNTIHVEGCWSSGFSTPSAYTLLVNVGTLSAGNYTAEFYTAACTEDGSLLLGPLTLRATLNFAVVAAPAAIPALQTEALIALGILVALVVAFRCGRPARS